VFTINNYTDNDIERILALPNTTDYVQYVGFGKEVGEKGTRHLQGYIHFKEQRRHASVTKLMPGAYVAIRNGNLAQAIAYCKKDGDYQSAGNIRIPNKDNKWADIIDLAEQGKLDEVKDEYPLIYLMHKPKLESLMNPILEPFQDDPKNHFEWWHGPTGTGKSREVWKQYPEHYDKQLNKWWDGYLYHDVVIIEEADPKKCEHMAYFFKRWADHYPFRAEIKNGHLNNIRPNKIIVTSNYTIRECFPNQQDWEPLERRFKKVHFDAIKTPTITTTFTTPFHQDFNMPVEPLIEPETNTPVSFTNDDIAPLFLNYDNKDLEELIFTMDSL